MGGSSKSVTVGYWYGIGFQMAVCYGPVDAMTEISVDDRVAWTGSSTANESFNIDQRELFGGEEREGGLNGTLLTQFGGPTQTPSEYLQLKIGATIPAFRGVFSLIWGGLVSANNPYLKPWAIKVRRILQGWYGGSAWYSAKATINTHDMNPAHIVYQCLTDPEWGMGYPSSSIDDTNFRAVADAMYSEGFGLSMIWNQQGQIQGFIKIVMDHIGGILRVDPTTGKFTLKLLRADYVADSLPEYGPSQISDLMSYQRAAWGETVNEVTIVFTDPATGKDTAVTVQDLANIQSQGAVVSQSISYPGIRSSTLASRVAMRDLAVRSTPLAKIKFTINRNAWALVPGDVFKLTWPKLGLSGVIFRVLNVNTGTLENGIMTVDAAEDVFGLPLSSYSTQQPIGWSEPGSVPAPAPNEMAFEIPYWDLARTMTAADLDYLDPLDGYLGVIAQRPSSDAYDYSLWTTTSGGSYENRAQVTHCPIAIMDGAIGLTDTTLSYTGAVGIEEVSTGGYVIIGGEWMGLDAIDTGAGTITVKRGVFDTVPDAHADESVIWFADGYIGQDAQLYVDAEVVDAKVQTKTIKGILDLDDATEMAVTMNQRQARPYPPGQVRINGSAYPAVITGPLHISWAHRDRLQQTAYIVSQNEGDIGPEAGTSYRVAIVGEGSTTTTDTEFSWCAPTESQLTITIGSTRDGLDSWQDHSITVERAGWGYNWGKYWGGASGAADGTSLVRCAPAWVYEAMISTGTSITFPRISLDDGYAECLTIDDSSKLSKLYWHDNNDAPTHVQTLGTRVARVVHDAGYFYFALNELSVDIGAHVPPISHGVGKVDDSGLLSATYNTSDLSHSAYFAQPFGGYLWVGESNSSTVNRIQRFALSDLSLHDSTTVEAIPYAATVYATRIYVLIYDPVAYETTVAAYDSSVSRQWATILPFGCAGIIYADGWLWTVDNSSRTLIRLNLTGTVDTYQLALPSSLTLGIEYGGGYLIVGTKDTGNTDYPIIVDPISGQQIPRN